MAHIEPKDTIPLYSADNELQDWLTLQGVARLESLRTAASCTGVRAIHDRLRSRFT